MDTMSTYTIPARRRRLAVTDPRLARTPQATQLLTARQPRGEAYQMPLAVLAGTAAIAALPSLTAVPLEPTLAVLLAATAVVLALVGAATATLVRRGRRDARLAVAQFNADDWNQARAGLRTCHLEGTRP